MAIKRPVLQYFGSKWRMSPKIISLFPPHRMYVEPFGGSACTLLRKEPSKQEVYNDLNEDLYNFFYCLRNHPDELIRKLELTPYSRKEHFVCKNTREFTDNIERARVFYVKCWQDRKQGVAWSGWKNWKVGSRSPSDNLIEVAKRFRKVQIESMDAIDCINYYDSDKTLFYIDPPYIDYGDCYEIGMSISEHKNLLKVLNNIKGYAIVSSRHNSVYDKILKHWPRVDVNYINTRSHNYVECLWMNYEFA